jgi:hypothetical protein
MNTPILAHITPFSTNTNPHTLTKNTKPPLQPEEVAEAKRLSSAMVHKALAMDGTCTGEHGVGLGKIKYLEGEWVRERLLCVCGVKGGGGGWVVCVRVAGWLVGVVRLKTPTQRIRYGYTSI